MDCLIDKQNRDYNYTSRYSPFYFYYNKNDEKYMYGITSWLNTNTSYALHTLDKEDTLDRLALKYYGRPDLFWVIADYNRIKDSYINLYDNFTNIKIPNITSIKFIK